MYKGENQIAHYEEEVTHFVDWTEGKPEPETETETEVITNICMTYTA